MEEREAEDQVNDFGRSAVGERKEEAVCPCPPFLFLWSNLMSRNITKVHANTCQRMMMIYHKPPLSPSDHMGFQLLSMRVHPNPRVGEKGMGVKRGKGRNGNWKK